MITLHWLYAAISANQAPGINSDCYWDQVVLIIRKKENQSKGIISDQWNTLLKCLMHKNPQKHLDVRPCWRRVCLKKSEALLISSQPAGSCQKIGLRSRPINARHVRRLWGIRYRLTCISRTVFPKYFHVHFSDSVLAVFLCFCNVAKDWGWIWSHKCKARSLPLGH